MTNHPCYRRISLGDQIGGLSSVHTGLFVVLFAAVVLDRVFLDLQLAVLRYDPFLVVDDKMISALSVGSDAGSLNRHEYLLPSFLLTLPVGGMVLGVLGL